MALENSEASDRASDPADWVDRHGDAMFRYALLRVRSMGTAEELVQEALVAALTGQRSFREGSTERTWLIGILKHKIVDHYRASARELPSEGLESADRILEDTFSPRGLWNAGPARWSGDPSDALEKEEFWDVLRDCVSGLPDHLADAFLLRELEQMSGEEVCKVLGISPTNLWARMHRARTGLRRCLEEHWFKREPREG